MSVYAWGKGDNGQLGLGSKEDSLFPSAIRSIPGNVVKVAGGWKHFLAINDLGDVYAWGRGREGQHGSGKKQPFLAVPQKVQSLNGDRMVDIGCGSNHCMAINQKGQVFQWGMGHKYVEDGQEVFGSIVAMPGLANEERKEWEEKRKKMVERSAKEYMKGLTGLSEQHLKLDYVTPEVNNFGKWAHCIQLQPTLVDELANEKVIRVIGGYGFSFAITEDGKLYSWGVNDKRQLGLGHRCNEGKPQLVKSLYNQGVKVVDLACGSQHVIALSSEGHMYSFGLGVFGQLGHGELFNETFPKRVEAVLDVKITQITCGSHHSLALSDKGEVYTWGSAEYGQQCGANEYTDWQAGGQHKHGERKYYFAVPRKIEGAFNGEKVVKIVCGDLHNVALTESGEIYTWGWGVHGALGHGDRNYKHFPTVVSQLRGEKMVDVDTCGASTFALSASGNTIFAYDFQNFVNNTLYSDLQFIIEVKEKGGVMAKKTIDAHKVIVCSRCPALKALIEEKGETAEGESVTKVLLEGTEYFVFLSLLKYLYTDNLIAVSYHIPKLLAMAEMYGLGRLVKLCKRYAGNLNKDEESVPDSRWAADLKQMVNSSEYSDLKFTLQDGTEVFAHKVILFSRSDYFKTIFEGKFQENDQKEMAIKEVSKEVFELCLSFMYTNQTPFEGHEDVIVDLVLAAGRFLLEELKQRIEKLLEEQLDEENAMDLLLISETAQTPKLRTACVDLVSENLPKFKANEGYKILARLHPNTKRQIDFLHFSLQEKAKSRDCGLQVENKGAATNENCLVTA